MAAARAPAPTACGYAGRADAAAPQGSHSMQDLVVALGLALAIEGMLYALFPDGMRRALAAVLEQPTPTVRTAGLAMAALGVVVIWLIRG